MKFRHLIPLLFLASCFGQSWSGIIDPTRAANWQRANVGVPGGIPTTYTQCGSTITAGTSAATINTDLAACSANTYLLLGAGTFNLSASVEIHRSNVILRGSGPTQTKLVFSAAGAGGAFSGSIYIAPSPAINSDSGNALPPCGGANATNCGSWTSGFTQGATSITISGVGTTGVLNGDIIVLDQKGDTSDTNGYLQCATTSPLFCMAQNAVEGRIIGGVPYSQEQFVKVTAGCASACNGAGPYTLTISPGLYANSWNQGNGASNTGMWFTKSLSGIGIENLSVDDTSCPDDITCQSGITFFDVYGGWVQNVIVAKTRRNHIWLVNGYRMEIRDSYLYGTKNAASQSYGIEFFPAFDSLVENTIAQQIATPIMFGGGAGNVLGYNFSIDNVQGPPSFSQGDYFSHSAGNYMNLWEGNITNDLITDQLHGTSGLFTAFRNWLNGYDWNTCTYSGGVCTNTNNFANHPDRQTQPIQLASYQRGINIIGNVLGTPGYHSTYQYATPTNSGTQAACNATIYTLGYANGPPVCNIGGTGSVADDTLVNTTLMRWGNYDVVNGAVRWDNTESSPGAVTYIGAQSTPASHTLPASFYLASKPSWFGSLAYPLIGPDVTGGNGGTFTGGTYAQGICAVGAVSGGSTCTSSLGGFANVSPAMACYFSTLSGPSDGSGAVLPFDASACYVGASSLSLDPGSIAFGDQPISTTSSGQTVTITNTTGSTVTLTSELLQTGTQYAISANTCGGSLAGSASCVVTITFTPTSFGAKTDNLVITSSGTGSPQNVPLSGTGVSSTSLFSGTSVFKGTSVIH